MATPMRWPLNRSKPACFVSVCCATTISQYGWVCCRKQEYSFLDLDTHYH